MNNRLLLPAISLLLLLMTSCHFYKEYDKESFSTYSWSDGQEISFTPNIEDNSKTYQITLGVRHHFALQTKGFSVNVKIVSPSGKERSENLDVKILDDNNKQIGSCAGDMCDLETLVLDDFRFEETGVHKILVQHNEHGYKIPGILSVGLIIDEKD